MQSDQQGLRDKAQRDRQPHSHRLREGLERRVVRFIEDMAKGGHSDAQWKLLTGEVRDLWHKTNCMFNEILEILEHNGLDTVQVEDHNSGN